MNNFKFRAYLKQLNKMVEVDTIDFTGEYILYKGQTEEKVFRFKDVELMISIGLVDKNGKEIFEGDIIDIHQTVNGQNLFIITMNENNKIVPTYLWGSKYQYNVEELLDMNVSWYEEKEIEVVGNIYENKELLKYE
mgnify:CR=1 FL=1